jgi:hypothetical protein
MGDDTATIMFRCTEEERRRLRVESVQSGLTLRELILEMLKHRRSDARVMGGDVGGEEARP